jgi:hypothetical protein
MYKRFTAWDYTIYALSLVGFLWAMFQNWLGFLIGIAVIAGLVLYERRLSGRNRYRAAHRYNAKAKRKSPFRVIPGTKPNDEPKYH